VTQASGQLVGLYAELIGAVLPNISHPNKDIQVRHTLCVRMHGVRAHTHNLHSHAGTHTPCPALQSSHMLTCVPPFPATPTHLPTS
jgi:hypothetical protein